MVVDRIRARGPQFPHHTPLDSLYTQTEAVCSHHSCSELRLHEVRRLVRIHHTRNSRGANVPSGGGSGGAAPSSKGRAGHPRTRDVCLIRTMRVERTPSPSLNTYFPPNSLTYPRTMVYRSLCYTPLGARYSAFSQQANGVRYRPIQANGTWRRTRGHNVQD